MLEPWRVARHRAEAEAAAVSGSVGDDDIGDDCVDMRQTELMELSDGEMAPVATFLVRSLCCCCAVCVWLTQHVTEGRVHARRAAIAARHALHRLWRR